MTQKTPLSRRHLIKQSMAGAILGGMPGFSYSESNLTTLEKLAFGSCNNQDRDQSFWQNIQQEEAQIWCSLGDNIYADHSTLEGRNAIYEGLFNDPYYSQFRQSTTIKGIWDDHDYASNNQGSEFKYKEASKSLFKKFFQFPSHHPIHNQEGIYFAEEYGKAPQKTLMIFLDTRWFKEPAGRYRSLLGTKQWQWLENQLAVTNPSALTIIASPINVTHPLAGLEVEGWAGYRSERQRLYDLISNRPEPVILLSGDRHYAEISRVPIKNRRGRKKIVYEFMSSGLTHYSRIDAGRYYRQAVSKRRNYGLIDISWESLTPSVSMSIKDPVTGGLLHSLACQFRI